MSSKLHERQDRPNRNADEFLSADIPRITPELLNYHIAKAYRLRSEATFVMTRKVIASLSRGFSGTLRTLRKRVGA